MYLGGNRRRKPPLRFMSAFNVYNDVSRWNRIQGFPPMGNLIHRFVAPKIKVIKTQSKTNPS